MPWELCNSSYATSEFSFDFAGPDATPYRVAACRLRSDLSESAKLAFRFGAACAAESSIFDIARYSNVEKHRFVSTYSQQLHDQTSYKSTADGYHSSVLRAMLSTHETYPASSCDCNSTAYEYSGSATEARLVSLLFYLHSGCSNPGMNSVLGQTYHSGSAAIIWPGYDYGDVGALGAVLYVSNDCSGCVGIAQPLPMAATQPYGVTTACNTRTTAYLPERVICAWAPSG